MFRSSTLHFIGPRVGGGRVLDKPAAAAENAKWKSFRKAYPLHVQGIAVSGPDEAKKVTVIVAEPPPHLTAEVVQALGPEFVEHVETAEHTPLGYHGG
jgi:hypothetical protein